MIEYGIVEDFSYTGFSLVFKKLLIECSWYNKCARIVYFKEDIEYHNKNKIDLFIVRFLEISVIEGINSNIIFKLDEDYYKRIDYNYKSHTRVKLNLFQYYLILIKEQI